jgi:3'-phosphoadenosine 5'-phosphosulfate (PAPS) 3'-phosphatase
MTMPIQSNLLPLCLDACILLQPIITSIYNNVGCLSRSKLDMSAVTLADIIVQKCLRRLITPIVKGFVGEESDEDSTIMDTEVKAIFTELDSLFVKHFQDHIVVKKIKDLELIAFIDPIDGTAEFIGGKGAESTICIGFASYDQMTTKYLPVAGLVCRPVATNTLQYAMGCKLEGYTSDTLNRYSISNTILTSNGAISPFLKALIKKGYNQISAGGCGNKMLMLIEGRGDIYIQDRGVSRWDTCAAQAILEAYGGTLCKLTDFISSSHNNSYTYSQTDINLDPNAAAKFGKMNIRSEEQYAILEKTTIGDNIHFVKPYSNICGLVACKNMDCMLKLRADILDVLLEELPVYN